MANELRIKYAAPGLTTLYAVVQNSLTATLVKASDGSVLSLATANWANAAITLSDTGHPTIYTGTMPAAADGDYEYTVFNSPSPAITDNAVGSGGTINWASGAASRLVTTSNPATIRNITIG